LTCATILLVIALMSQPAAATDGDTSTASITSFSQTNPADGIDFWPDGFNYSMTNTKMYENFAGLGAWMSFNLGTGESKGTSGDYGYIRCKAIGADDWSGMYTNRPSFTAASLGNTYFVIRYKGNTTGQALWRVHGFISDSMAGTGWVIATLTQTTSWTTYRTALPTTNALESISLEVEIITGQPNVEIDYDFLLLTPSNRDGWQHDCSGTGNISLEAGTSISSDGDKVTVTGTYPTASKTFWFIDNTVTHAGLPPSYYPFLEIVISSVSNNPIINLWVQLSGGSETYVSGITSAAGTYRYYLPAVSALAVTWLVIYANRASSGVSSYTVDQMSIYAITNFTTTVTGGGIGDVAYISSNALVVDKSSGTLFQFDRDPAISVAQATYQVWNITTNAKTAVGISLYVAAWTTMDDETRGAMPTGTTTDIRIRADADCTISAIKFITDATAPTCVRSNVAPVTPNDDETVTLSAVVTDPTEVYKVWTIPVTHPAGWSHSAFYSLTETGDNLWTYSFATLNSGYYCFKVLGNDGANNSTLIEQSYVDFTVTTPTITFTLVGNAVNDVQDNWITFGFVTNQGTSTFYVWDNDTYVGASYEGFYQVAKPTSLGLHNFTILVNSSQTTIDATHQTKNFASSSLWLWQNWKYTVNPVQLSFDEVTFPQNNESVGISGRVWTSANHLHYTIYEANLGWTSGTVSGVTSGSWISWMWYKSSTTSTSNFTVAVTDGTYNTTFRGFYLKIAGNQWITYGSSLTEDHRTYVQNSSIIYNNPPGFFIDQGTATIFAVGGVIIAMFALMVSKQIVKGEILKGIRKGLSQ